MESGYFTIFDFLTRSTFAAWRQPVICVIKRDFPVAATCAFVGSFSGFLSDVVKHVDLLWRTKRDDRDTAVGFN